MTMQNASSSLHQKSKLNKNHLGECELLKIGICMETLKQSFSELSELQSGTLLWTLSFPLSFLTVL